MSFGNYSSKGELLLPYSICHGYVVPDSEDGFNGFDIEDPFGLVTCPFVRIPYDRLLDESHYREDSLKMIEERKRKVEVDATEEIDDRMVKKIKEEDEGKIKLDDLVENEEEEISLPNLILGILCPKYKVMPQYRGIPGSLHFWFSIAYAFITDGYLSACLTVNALLGCLLLIRFSAGVCFVIA